MIVVVNPGEATTNLGDRIISEAVYRQLIDPLTAAGKVVTTIPMHGNLKDEHRRLLREADEVIVCGTNLLSDHMRFRTSWQWDRSDIELTRDKLTIFGVGWWQYQRTGIDPVSGAWLRGLAGAHPWAVRDEYSERRLTKAGIAAVHTSCPTLWDCNRQALPGAESRVVVTLTDYNQDRAADEWLVELVNRRFEEVLYWPQGPGDEAYIRSLAGASKSHLIDPTVEAFNAELATPDTAYVGLRLHGGIRAIQLGVPTLILGIDNRAREISQSVGLNVISRNAIRDIEDAVGSGRVSQLRLPQASITEWREGWLR